MRKFVMEFLPSTTRDGLRCHPLDRFHSYGDWLAVDARSPDDTPTPKDLIGTAYMARCAELLHRIALLLGKPAGELAAIKAMRDRTVAAFNLHYVTPAGRIIGDSQTAYAIALEFDLLPEALRPAALDYLVRDITRRGNHLSTGFVGTPLLAPVLSRFGRTDIAYRLLLQTTYPSWFYPILQGATTMWERWNSYVKGVGFGPVSMNSFNHYAYGAIGQWMYATIAGIRLDDSAPAYKRSIIQPEPASPLTSAKGRLMTPFGPLASAWTIDGEMFNHQITIPPNTTSRLVLPQQVDPASVEFTSSAKPNRGQAREIELPSGSYTWKGHYRPVAP